MTFEQLITILLILVFGIPDIINALKGKPTIIGSLMTNMRRLTNYLLKELTTKNPIKVINALWAIAVFLFFFVMLTLVGIEFIKHSALSGTLIALTISSIGTFWVVMHVCEKYTRPLN